MNRKTMQGLVDHYARAFGELSYEARWKAGPIDQLSRSFRVLVFEPSRSHRCWTYATCGMSDPSDDSPLELHLFSPQEFVGHIELLTVVAHYHQTGHPLGVTGTTVNFGRGWMPGSSLTRGLISLPYPHGPDLEHFTSDDGKLLAECLWLLPITEDEFRFKKQHGLEGLEARFDEVGLNFADPNRASVVKDITS